MSAYRRLVALATTLVVAWTALWPLVSAAHARMAGEEVVLCHQAGTMVAPDEMPSKSALPGPQEGQTHCPLCIMAFFGTAVAPPSVPLFQFSTLAERCEVYSAPIPRDFQVALPQSRAPPTSFPV